MSSQQYHLRILGRQKFVDGALLDN